MKFFSFLKGDLHKEEGVKIIPKEEFSTLLSAEEVLQKATHEMDEYKKETLAECEKLKKQAYEDGYQEGLKKLNQTILKFNKMSKDLHEDIQNKITPLALSAAKKILGEELKLNPERIVQIVSTSLRPVTQHKHVKIYVNKADLEVLEEHKPEIKKILDQVETFSLQERSDIEPGGCIIETEAGIINAQLENQWRALESAFEAFLKKRP